MLFHTTLLMTGHIYANVQGTNNLLPVVDKRIIFLTFSIGAGPVDITRQRGFRHSITRRII